MYPWRETYSTSTYSSTILSSERKLLCYHLLVETSTLLKISQIEFATRSVCHHIPCSLTHIFFLVLPNYKQYIHSFCFSAINQNQESSSVDSLCNTHTHASTHPTYSLRPSKQLQYLKYRIFCMFFVFSPSDIY